MQPAAHYIEQLRQYKRANAMRLGIRQIGLFGSVARGEQRPDSDLDIFIDLNEPDYFALCAIRHDLERLCNCRVDLVHLHKYLRPLFLDNIKRDAILA